MNFCKDCKHQFIKPLAYEWEKEDKELRFSRCRRKEVMEGKANEPSLSLYLVNGSEIEAMPYCQVSRMPGTACGPDGKFFEPKEPT